MKAEKSASIISALLLFVGLIWTVPCAAGDKERAKEKFMEGVELFGEENYPGALAAFEESYQIRPKASVLYNIGMCEKALFRYSDSMATFRKYLAKGSKIKAARRSEVKAAIAEMERLVGRLQITDAPEDAEVLINGKSVGKTPFKDPILLDPGRHTVEVTKDGYESLKIDITAASGAEVPLRAALSPARATLKVKCDEEKALVYVDDEAVGNCPYSGKVATGTRTIAIEAPGKKRFEQEIEAEAGGTAVVSATLEVDAGAGVPAAATTPTPAPTETESPKTLGAAWSELVRIVFDAKESREVRIAAIDTFLHDYPVRNRYAKRVTGWKLALQAGHEPESYHDPLYMRTKKEHFSLRLYGGSYGGGGRIDFGTRRWRWFYLEGGIGGGGGMPGSEGNDTRFWAGIGPSLGIPWNIGRSNHHEIRTGVGFFFGAMYDYKIKTGGGYFDDTVETEEAAVGAMIMVVPELYYVWHAAKRFALTVGADIYLGFLTPEDIQVGESDTKYKRPFPVINGFIGFRI